MSAHFCIGNPCWICFPELKPKSISEDTYKQSSYDSKLELISTAIYPNRIEDKEKLETELHLSEFGSLTQEFYLPNNDIFAKGHKRIVYGDHGPYIEFEKHNIIPELESKFNNDQLLLPPENECKYYYYWLNPVGFPEVKVYLQLKPVTNLPNAPKRQDGKKSKFNRKEGYADYKRGYYYVSPDELRIK